MTAVRTFRVALFALSLAAAGCHAQVPAQSAQSLSPEMARRVEVLIRSKSNVPPDYTIQIGTRSKSQVPGFDEIPVTFQANGRSTKPVNFLLSTDGNTLAQFTKFDISADPKTFVSPANRPSRGGPANAPVMIVEFDDLECPFCSKMHAQLFPALTDRYKNQVRIVYRDFPLDIHPWAMRAAIDTSCVGALSNDGYWNLVDYIHAHAAELGGEEKSIAKANATLDSLTVDEGKRQKVDAAKLNACIAKQDDTVVKATIKEAEALGVDATPALFINGEKLSGAQPMEFLYRMIDDALRAEGQVPPPPVTPASTAAPVPTTTPAAKPSN
nr:thioredoxin domain-containing protein [Granulicella sp. dw_53]